MTAANAIPVVRPTRLPSGAWGVTADSAAPKMGTIVRVQTRTGKSWFASISSAPETTQWGWRAHSERLSDAQASQVERTIQALSDAPDEDEALVSETLSEPDFDAGATLTLNRSGSFSLRVAGDSHCGIHDGDGVVPCTYALTLRCESTGLDQDGFLVEQVGIDRYFNSLPTTTLSCEELCKHCARELYRKVMRENPHCRILGIKLTIAPTPPGMRGAAGMTFEWAS